MGKYEEQIADAATIELGQPPEQYLLSGKIADGWRLTQPILLEVEFDEQGEYVVYYDPYETHGVGDSLEEAVHEFGSVLVDLYEYLDRTETSLSLYYHKLLEQLRLAISPL